MGGCVAHGAEDLAGRGPRIEPFAAAIPGGPHNLPRRRSQRRGYLQRGSRDGRHLLHKEQSRARIMRAFGAGGAEGANSRDGGKDQQA